MHILVMLFNFFQKVQSVFNIPLMAVLEVPWKLNEVYCFPFLVQDRKIRAFHSQGLDNSK